MARDTPSVQDGRLTLPDGRQRASIPVGSAAWWAWLADAGTTSFRFGSGAERFTARREHKAGGRYWYAYRRQAGRLRKAYLGKAEDLTLERLEAAAATLAGSTLVTSGDQAPAPQAGAHGLGRPGASVAHPTPSPLLATKLFVPRPRRDIVPRPRLRARLDAGLDGLLTVVSAPAGAGKTTVLSEWIAHSLMGTRAVAWLSLDDGDRDPLTFLRYLVAALQTISPVVGGSTLALLHAPQPPPLPALLTLLLNELVALPPSVLVLDDYHVLQSAAIHEALTFLLDHLPPQLHLIVATREDPPLPLARLRARRQLNELRAADLRFTSEEAATFLREVMRLPLPAAEVAALEERTEGWIAGLQLAALAMQEHSDLAGFIGAFTGSNRFVLDFLASEVLDRLPPQLRTFVLQTSILERMCAPLCNAVMLGGRESEIGGQEPGDDAAISSPIQHPQATIQNRNGQLLLEELERMNLFLVPLDDERQWYRYHHLFAEVLRGRLTSGVSGEVVTTLHLRASAWFEQQGLLDEAVRHALAAPDVEQAAVLVERYGLQLILRSEVLAVRAWVEQLPRVLIRTRPRLALAYGWTLAIAGHLDAAEELLAHAAPVLHAPDLAPDIAGELDVLRSTLAFFRRDLRATLELAQQALARLPWDQQSLRAAATFNIARVYVRRGELAAASTAFAEVGTLGEAGESYVALLALENLAWLQVRQGQISVAIRTREQALRMVARWSGRTIPVAGMAYVGIGEVLCEWNELDRAMESLTRGIELLRGSMESEVLVRGYVALARTQQAQGAGNSALATLQSCEEWFAQMHIPGTAALAWLAAQRARLWIRQGNLSAAAQWAAECAFDGDDEVGQAQWLTLVRLRLAQSEREPAGPQLQAAPRRVSRPSFDEAAGILAQRLVAAETGEWTNQVIEILVLQALVYQALGQIIPALAALERALMIAAPEGYVRVFVDEGAPMAALLAQGLRVGSWGSGEGRQDQLPEGTRRAYAQKLLDAFPVNERGGVCTAPAAPTRDPQSPTPMLEPLTNRELEVLQLIATGASNGQIAGKLVISLGTVKKHINNLFGKLGVQSRTQALVRASELNLL